MRATQKEIEWRKSKILSMLSDGYNPKEIVEEFKSKKSRDIVYRHIRELKAEAMADMKQANEELPFEYNKTLEGVKGVIRYMADIMYSKKDNGEYEHDIKERLQAAYHKLHAHTVYIDMKVNKVLSHEGIELDKKYQGLIDQNGNPLKDAPEQPA